MLDISVTVIPCWVREILSNRPPHREILSNRPPQSSSVDSSEATQILLCDIRPSAGFPLLRPSLVRCYSDLFLCGPGLRRKGGDELQPPDMDTSDEDSNSWLPPHSQPGTVRLPAPPSTLIRINYQNSYQVSLLIRSPTQPLSIQMKHPLTPLPWAVVHSHTNLVLETLSTSPGAEILAFSPILPIN